MPSNKPQFILRTDKELIDKLKYIANQEHRTATKQLEYILANSITDYESKNGEIKIIGGGQTEV